MICVVTGMHLEALLQFGLRVQNLKILTYKDVPVLPGTAMM